MTGGNKVIEGIVKRVTFQSEESGFAVLQVESPSLVEPVTVVGRTNGVREGMFVVAQGAFIEHPKFGAQFTANSISESIPTSPETLKAYIASGIVPGIGKRLAAKIVKALGDNPPQTLITEVDRIAALPGIGQAKALSLASHFQAQEAKDGVIRFCQQHGMPAGLSKRIFDRYKDRALSVLTNDPYRIARDLKGVGFVTADKIAMSLGLPEDSDSRIDAAILYTLEKAADDGHCYIQAGDVSKKLSSLIHIPGTVDLSLAIERLVRERSILHEQERISLPTIADAESFIARWISYRCDEESHESILTGSSLKAAITEAEEALGVTFSAEQREGLRLAASKKLLLITGGPGCGKTTLIRGLVTIFQKCGLQIALTAPTGRAAQRMSSVCDHPASTVHRLLKFDPATGSFVHGMNEPLTVDVVIIDEASMLDVFLARDLLSAVTPSARVIFVGDKDQLPSVGPGRVFGDLLSIRNVPAVPLMKLFRRDETSAINDIALRINAGEVPEIPSPDGVTKTDAYFLPTKSAEEAAHMVEHLVANQIPKHFGFSRDEILILTPSNRGPLGTLSLNEKLQSKFTVADEEQEVIDGDRKFRVGDKVCQRVNNYNIDPLGVFNGDTGTIYAADRLRKRLVIDLWDGRLITYEREHLHQLSLGYAVTVHRSQGSESPVVVLALDESQFTLLERQLLYTAVTRAKKLLVVVGSKRAFAIACKRSTALKRLTYLKERTEQLINQEGTLSHFE